MVRRENRNLLQRSRVDASGAPDYGSEPMINRQTLFHIGMQGGPGLEHVMQILISMLGSREHWQADILSAFQRHRLPIKWHTHRRPHRAACRRQETPAYRCWRPVLARSQMRSA